MAMGSVLCGFLWFWLLWHDAKPHEIDPARCKIWGPGLTPDRIVMPARYFFIELVDSLDQRSNSTVEDIKVEVKGTYKSNPCRVWTQVLPRHDGTFIARYKLFGWCDDAVIGVTWRGRHLAASPYRTAGRSYADDCDCPRADLGRLLDAHRCAAGHRQIERDLEPFADGSVDMDQVVAEAVRRFGHAGSYSFCHYAVVANAVHRRCYGQHVGFSMFADNALLWLARRARLPDVEFLVNLGDWPLVQRRQTPLLPVFSWCGSSATADIVLPTYDITEASLECMGRVTLDMLSVQSKPDVRWEDKVEMAFWRGRDSRRERLDLIRMARRHPDLLNASLTNFFFFRDLEAELGPKQEHVSFFRFFDFKYQVNIDGTVAAYRFPYLLAGDAVVLKQDSDYYEHFYGDLEPMVHYVPVKADLSDLPERVRWARRHDDVVRRIGANGRRYAAENLLPNDIFCYHALLLQKWTPKLKKAVRLRDGMTPVAQTSASEPCPCQAEAVPSGVRDEL